jgi:hypothetical protein
MLAPCGIADQPQFVSLAATATIATGTNGSGDIAGRYGAQNLPTSYFINSDGTIGLRKTGVMNYTFIKAHLDLLR